MSKLFCMALVVLSVALGSAQLVANDKVKLLAGNQSAGELVEISPTELVIKLGSTKKKFAVNDVDSVSFDVEPNDLTQARFAIRAGRYEDALALVEKIDMAKVARKEIVGDIEFYKALAGVRMALAGNGSKAEAGKQLFDYEKANENSFHHFEACEALGDVFATLNRFDNAKSYYGKLAAAPWPEYKLRAGVLLGRALVGLKQYDKAEEKFDEVLKMEVEGKEADRQKLAASLGKASVLAGTGKTDEAIKAVDAIIAKTDPENQELNARAYIILGNCYKSAKKSKEALLAFLHVDLLYSRFPELHAEALANLATLWVEADKSERGNQALATLKEKYPTSTWAQK